MASFNAKEPSEKSGGRLSERGARGKENICEKSWAENLNPPAPARITLSTLSTLRWGGREKERRYCLEPFKRRGGPREEKKDY